MREPHSLCVTVWVVHTKRHSPFATFAQSGPTVLGATWSSLALVLARPLNPRAAKHTSKGGSMTRELFFWAQRKLSSGVAITCSYMSPSFSEEVRVKEELWKPEDLEGRGTHLKRWL